MDRIHRNEGKRLWDSEDDVQPEDNYDEIAAIQAEFDDLISDEEIDKKVRKRIKNSMKPKGYRSPRQKTKKWRR